MAIQVAKRLGASRMVGPGRDLGPLEALASVGADAVVQLADDAEATATALATTAAEVEGSSSSS
jgi:NADPH:quinone reductase-like Zn-dependent oxidoreductase